MSITRKIYFNWSKDGVTWVDMSDYVLSISGFIGRTDWKTRVANVGMVTIELKNIDRRFSPEFTASPYYGQLLPNIPVKVEVTDSTGTHRVLTLWTADWDPHPDQYAQDLRCTLTCVDRMAKLQDADISLPIQTSTTAGALLRKITSEVYQTGVSEGTIYFTAPPVANDTVTIGLQTYVYKNPLTPANNEILLSADLLDFPLSLAAAINRDVGSGTLYGAGTGRHASVTANGYSSNGYVTNVGSWAIGNTYQAHAQQLVLDETSMPARYVQVYLEEEGAALADLTIKFVTDNAGKPSNTLVNANATATILRADVGPAPLQWIKVTFPGVFTVTTGDWLVIETAQVHSLTNFFRWGEYANGVYGQSAHKTYASGIWENVTGAMNFIINGRVEVTANARGAWGNAIVLSDTGANIAVSGAILSGGVDGPVGAVAYETGALTLDYAGDTWIAGETSALTAIDDTVRSEFGLFWAARNGDLTFKDQHYQFALANTTPAMTCSDDHTGQVGKLSKDNVINRATVSYQPRSLLASTVIAKAKQPIKVLGKAGTRPVARWNPTQLKTRQAGEKIQVVPYVDAGTAEQVGAVNIVQPLTPTTDYTIYDTEDKSGFNYTTEDYVQFAFALVGSGVQVQVTNSATGPLWIHDLQISGSALSKQDTQQFTAEDATSRAAYGLKTQDYSIPFPSDDVDTFAEMLATFWVNAYKDPRYRIESISFYGVETVGGVSVFDLEIGDLILLSENQTYAQNFKLMILGLGIELPETGLHTITASVQRLEYDSYWQIETAGHSTLGVNTRLAL